MNGDVYTAESVSVKHDLAHLLAVPERVHRRFCEQNLLAFGVDLELLVKSIIPQVLHVIPLLDDAILHGVAYLQHGAGGGRLVTAHDVLDYYVIVRLLLRSQNRPADNGRKLVLGKVLRSVADLEEAGAAVED